MYGMWDILHCKSSWNLFTDRGTRAWRAVWSGWGRLSPGRPGHPTTAVPFLFIHLPLPTPTLSLLALANNPACRWPSGGTFLSLLRQTPSSSLAFCPNFSNQPTLYSQNRVNKPSSCGNFCSNPMSGNLHGLSSPSFVQAATCWWVSWGLGWVAGNFHPNLWLS